MPAETAARGKARRVRGGSASPRVQVSEMQRARLLAAATVSIAELGYARASVAHITARARVSRRTFYDLFESREDCLLAVLGDTVDRIAQELAGASLEGVSWCERVRTGLWIVLSFFDREPELARLCVVDSASGGPGVQEWRQDLIARLAAIVDEGRPRGARAAARVPALTAEGSVGAVLAILHTRLLNSEREPVSGLLGQLMGMIVLPYMGASVALSECKRPAPKTPSPAAQARVYHANHDPLRDIPMRLTYRTARVLEAVAEHPGTSNRFIGEQADIYDQGQVSKLLARLEGLGLLANTGAGHTHGERNAWSLTPLGERVTKQLTLTNDTHQETS
ncbi:MAG TPA: TetR family transcriptional regulator [Solirubrobacteraceae bacterium]|jgi:AcrR family transcriptional regulator/DNA-binding MarR family transcriptional regulator|nr:TetR family transcriptional regulator [Solirubrobacteraceae bacterium]